MLVHEYNNADSPRQGLRALETLDNMPDLDVVATRSEDGKTVTLLCVNRSLEQDLVTDFALGNFNEVV